MAADCKSAAPCELRRFESSPVHQDMEEGRKPRKEESPQEENGASLEERESQEAPEEDAGPRRTRTHKWIALALLAILAVLAWTTLGPGKIRLVVLVLLGVFGFRIVAASSR